MFSTFVHLSSLSAYVGVPFGWFLGPLILWLIKKDESPMVDRHGRTAMNFNLTLTIVFAVLYVLGILAFLAAYVATGASFDPPDPAWPLPTFGLPLVGFFIVGLGGVALVVVHVTFTVIAATHANKGQPYEYPLAIRFFE